MKRIRFRLSLLANPAVLFVAIAILFGTYFVLKVPPLWGVDEYTHFDRAWQISSGVLTSHHVDEWGFGGALPENLVDLNFMVHVDLADNHRYPDAFHRQDVDNIHAYDKLIHEKPSKKLKEYPFNGSGIYSPVAYAPAIVGIFLGRVSQLNLQQIIFLGRFFTLFFYISAIGFSIFITRNRGLKWFLFVFGLIPMSLFQASIVNADSMAIALSVICFTLLIEMLTSRPRTWQWAAVTLSAGLLPLVKPNYILISFLVAILILTKASRLFWKRLLLAAAFAGVMLILLLAWVKISNTRTIATAGPIPPSLGHVNADEQMSAIIHQPDVFFVQTLPQAFLKNTEHYIGSMLGDLGWNMVEMPEAAIHLLLILLVISALFSQPSAPRLWSLGFILAAAAGFFSILVTLYLTFSAVKSTSIQGVQGRYLLPLLPFALVGVARFIPIKVQISPRAAALIFPLASSACLFGAAAFYTIGTY